MAKRGPKPGEGGRPTQDRYVYKTRWRTASGHVKVTYSSVFHEAEAKAERHRAAGTLVFFGRYKFDEEM